MDQLDSEECQHFAGRRFGPVLLVGRRWWQVGWSLGGLRDRDGVRYEGVGEREGFH